MKYYLAPLEGITTYIYRNAYHSIFCPMDKYFTPFIVPRMKKSMGKREINDILPEHNQGLYVVPQLLTNKAEDFIKAVHKLMDYGYEEVNLNLGCPSGTVVARNKGSGFLSQPEELDRFLDEIFSKLSIRISIKTRIGRDSPEEFAHLLEIFNRYPLAELIIHPRIREDYYRNKPNLAVFGEAAACSRSPVCYNGDIFIRKDYETLIEKFPGLTTVMLGRGIIANPCLRSELTDSKGAEHGQKEEASQIETTELFQKFHMRLYTDYQEFNFGESNVLFKMKEVWSYMVQSFSNYEKYAKKIRKAESFRTYEAAVNALFREQKVMSGKGFVIT